MLRSYFVLSAVALLRSSNALAPSVYITSQTHVQHVVSSTVLHGTKRRGRLGNNIAVNEDGKISKIMTKKEKQKLGNSKMSRSTNDKSEISPLLAEWAKGDDTKTNGSTATVASAETASVFTPFDDEEDSGRGKKRKTNSATVTLVNSAKVDQILGNIEEMLSTTNCDIPNLLSEITSLIDLQSQTMPALKSIMAKKPLKDDENQPNYRLAWAGSDKAICHIGTALHKVPLARLQEIFLCLGYNRWELLEVIRILGPFPNVRNTLKGDVKVMKGKRSGFSGSGGAVSSISDSSGKESVRMNIAYNSMIDGTGKEILAGKATNVKYVDLDVWFATEKAIVCTMVNEDLDGDAVADPLTSGNGERATNVKYVDLDVWFATEKAIVCTMVNEDLDGDVVADPLTSGNGERVLLFVAEDDLDGSLEKLPNDREDLDGDVVADPLTSGNGERVLLLVAEDDLDGSLEKLRAA
ncbi:hypothetical protein ACHAWO_007345 [Cyclotella atomus]|uniref:Uncharacterized protein n=1 Tax=Cyclotella atomus TaxID=382360 RepID=A0ABD3P8G2_9STRA